MAPTASRGALAVARGFLAYAPSCNLGVWADIYRRLNGFSESYGQAHDVDFCWRAQLAGFSLRFAPGADVQYRLRSDLRGVWRQALAMGREAALLHRDFHAVLAIHDRRLLRRVGRGSG